MNDSREIRKITLGENPLAGGMVFVVGKDAVSPSSGYIISSITEDTNNYVFFGITRYNVYIKLRKVGSDELLWKAFERVPVTIEYSLPNDIDTVIVK
jgi:hypothetical protein